MSSAVIVIGESLSWLYGALAPLVTGQRPPGSADVRL